MAELGLFQILELVSKASADNKRIELLRQHDSKQLRMLFQYAFDSRVVWLLPETNPPYTPTTFLDQERTLFGRMDKLFYYCKGGADNLRQMKREMMFIELLEGIHPKDAVLLLAVKNKTVPYAHITPALVKAAYPDIDLVWDETRNFTAKQEEKKVKNPEPTVEAEVSTKKKVSGNGANNKEWWNTPAGLLAKEKMRQRAAEKKANGQK